jgi:acetyl esterase/lipase
VTFKREIYRADSAKPLHLDYYAASSASKSGGQASPWVMVVHGGGWDSGDSEQLADLNSYLAGIGYGVVSISYRLAPESQWPAAKEDALAALRYVRENAATMGLDPERWAILGRSAGGQIAGTVAYSAPLADRPKALIAFYTPTDMTFGYEVGEENDILGSRKIIRNYFGGTPYEQKELFRTASLTELYSEESCPTLLFNGKMDTLVWFKHSERLHFRLRQIGIESAALFTEWGPHGFDYFFRGPEAQLSTHAVEYFLSRTLPLK